MITIASAMIASAFYLHPHDRVVFYGDSITELRLYTTYVEAFVTTRYPNLDVAFFNRGWAGDSSWGGGGGDPAERVRRDVEPLRPTVAFVLLGMNDGGYVPVNAKIEETIRDWYPKVLDLLSKVGQGPRLTLARTSPWDDYAHHFATEGAPPEPWAPWKGYNRVLQKYGELARSEAQRRGGVFVDFNQPLADVLMRAAKVDPTEAEKIIPDAIHPGPAGHLVMAGELLRAWGADPVVSEVALDAATHQVTSQNKTAVTEYSGMSWKQHDQCLPFAIEADDKTVDLVKSEYGFDALLNRQIVKVLNLEEGRYELSIDGKAVGKFAASELAGGVNLAGLKTPMEAQAHKVFDLCHRRSEIEFFAWRSVERENGPISHAREAAGGLEKLAESLRAEARRAAAPRVHQFALKRVNS